ncbi:helix-turn-helix transcriptional regulator [Nocardia uniformis]|uniref:Helix-turn-helix transcriptional regulator n=1 Tax=Nocardia uniformis TaxID=53432 RepID=A0A849BX09_9NOCA|nr:helix-turn-helix transcriptional regulator [Nocardia uniformis]NNH69546.1 helix-turn-helix transcriptional regulator [Nocardia uniformis]
MSDNELGLFLRTRREAVPPASVGLPVGPRRRTPGLRRAELAMLADVSVEYITRLEQGRDRHPSQPVLMALADALRMTSSERIHMYQMAKSSSGFHCLGGAQPNREVRPTIRAILDRLEPTPAVVVNRLTEILASTEGFRALMDQSGLFDAGLPANFARYIFTDERARTAFPDWEHTADSVVATLKSGPFRADRMVATLVDELSLTVGAPFTDRLLSIPSLPAASGIRRVVHPEAGDLRLAYEPLDLSADDDQQLIVHLPADEATATALDRLIGRRPGGLRALG